MVDKVSLATILVVDIIGGYDWSTRQHSFVIEKAISHNLVEPRQWISIQLSPSLAPVGPDKRFLTEVSRSLLISRKPQGEPEYAGVGLCHHCVEINRVKIGNHYLH